MVVVVVVVVVVERQPDVPARCLAQGLLELIRSQYQNNQAFRSAFTGFWSLCQTSLNPPL